jgi:cellulose biosynthesis protein BcsQ
MLVPLIPTTLSLRTYEQIRDYVGEHKKLSLQLMPFFSMVDRRKKLHLETIEDKQNIIPGVLKTGIPYLSIIENMGSYRAPVGLFAPKSQAAVLFDELWKEISLRANLDSD